MKEYIVGFAVFLVLIFFPLQWSINQVNHYKIQTTNNIVYNAAQKARTDGYFKQSNLDEIRMQITSKLKVEPSDIRIEATRTPKYRLDYFDEREMIYFEVGIPIDKVIAANIFYGISDQANSYEYIISGEVPSELLP